jgi:hypothetical protein
MWSEEEKLNLPKKYNCQLIYTKATITQAKDKSLPKDAYLVYYEDCDGNVSMDVCRCSKRSNLFDLYYDKFGNVKNICFGYGNVSPRLWGETNSSEKKKRNS